MMSSGAIIPGRLCAAMRCLMVIGFALLGAATDAFAQDSLEYSLKASFLYKFGSFVSWPKESFASDTSPVVLCIAGQDNFGDIIDRAVAGQYIGKRSIEVKRIPVATPEAGCHIMYIAGSPSQTVTEGVEAMRHSHTLTFTNSSQDLTEKGIVHFILQDNRLKFEIDDKLAAENGLVLSSKVLSLAVSVKPRT
jgi:hypothetical protein